MNPEHAPASASHFIPMFAATCLGTPWPVSETVEERQEGLHTAPGLLLVGFRITSRKLVAYQRGFNQ